MRQKKQFSDHKIPEVNPTHENSSKSLLTKTGCFDEKFFVIIDTNVFLSNLKFLSDLSKRRFKGMLNEVASTFLILLIYHMISRRWKSNPSYSLRSSARARSD